MGKPSCKDKTAYFAHPISTYGTAEEAEILRYLNSLPDISKVINPSDAAIAAHVAQLKAAGRDSEVMPYFKQLCNDCQVCFFTTFGDDERADGAPDAPNRVGAGVWYEVESFWAREANAFHVRKAANGLISVRQVTSWEGYTILDRPQTKALLRASGNYNG